MPNDPAIIDVSRTLRYRPDLRSAPTLPASVMKPPDVNHTISESAKFAVDTSVAFLLILMHSYDLALRWMFCWTIANQARI